MPNHNNREAICSYYRNTAMYLCMQAWVSIQDQLDSSPPHNEFIKRMSPCRETKLNTPIPACMRRWLHYVLRTRYFIRKNWVAISGDVFLRCCHTFMKLGNSFFSSPLKRYKKNTRHGKTRANTGKHGISAYCPFSLLKRWGN